MARKNSIDKAKKKIYQNLHDAKFESDDFVTPFDVDVDNTWTWFEGNKPIASVRILWPRHHVGSVLLKTRIISSFSKLISSSRCALNAYKACTRSGNE